MYLIYFCVEPHSIVPASDPSWDSPMSLLCRIKVIISWLDVLLLSPLVMVSLSSFDVWWIWVKCSWCCGPSDDCCCTRVCVLLHPPHSHHASSPPPAEFHIMLSLPSTHFPSDWLILSLHFMFPAEFSQRDEQKLHFLTAALIILHPPSPAVCFFSQSSPGLSYFHHSWLEITPSTEFKGPFR